MKIKNDELLEAFRLTPKLEALYKLRLETTHLFGHNNVPKTLDNEIEKISKKIESIGLFITPVFGYNVETQEYAGKTILQFCGPHSAEADIKRAVEHWLSRFGAEHTKAIISFWKIPYDTSTIVTH